MTEERELVRVVHPIVDGNATGYCVKYRDAMRADDVLYVEPATVDSQAPAAIVDVAETAHKRGPGRPRKEQESAHEQGT